MLLLSSIDAFQCWRHCQHQQGSHLLFHKPEFQQALHKHDKHSSGTEVYPRFLRETATEQRLYRYFHESVLV